MSAGFSAAFSGGFDWTVVAGVCATPTHVHAATAKAVTRAMLSGIGNRSLNAIMPLAYLISWRHPDRGRERRVVISCSRSSECEDRLQHRHPASHSCRIGSEGSTIGSSL